MKLNIKQQETLICMPFFIYSIPLLIYQLHYYCYCLYHWFVQSLYLLRLINLWLTSYTYFMTFWCLDVFHFYELKLLVIFLCVIYFTVSKFCLIQNFWELSTTIFLFFFKFYFIFKLYIIVLVLPNIKIFRNLNDFIFFID